MLTVELTDLSPRRRWGIPRRRRFSVLLPQSWQELGNHAFRQRAWVSLVTDGAHAARQLVLEKMLQPLPARIRFAIDDGERAAMLLQLEWISMAPSTEPPVDHFEHRGERYFFPKKDFENGSCGEFALADNAYEAFVSSMSAADGVALVAILCREARRDGGPVHVDVRVPLVEREEAEARAKKLEGMPEWAIVAVALYFAGVKKYVHDTYWMLFDSGPATSPEGEAVEQEAPANGPKFGWWSKYLEVAETGLFGNYQQVVAARFHLVCMFLVDQHQKAERARAEHNRINSKFNHDTH